MKQAKITWNANTEPDLDGYQLYRSIDGAASTLLITLDKAAVEYTDSSLPQSGSDFEVAYSLIAFDMAGNKSPFSDTVKKVMNVNPPQAPLGLTLTIFE